MNALTKIVKDCITQHEGGERFFDALDARVRDDSEIIQKLYDIAYERLCRREEQKVLVVSGKFGAIFANHVDNYGGFDIVVVEGGLRSNEFTGFGSYEYDIFDSAIVFIDDSYYLGRTEEKICTAIDEAGGHHIHTVVAYDGSISKKKKNLTSLYRYHE